ncbi:4623_t:CDS:2 [Dentiscutata erythropus]|uniref:4623_t:CDS:1 n=1 Tax=Dentiscutata erythropus TaxID=1348616 RepID=A0A9N9DAW0_9GLOM|nr:4623_t:CDS:2 [Dentiscutata erythropus]
MSSGQRTFDGCIRMRPEFAPGTPGYNIKNSDTVFWVIVKDS